MDLEPYPNTNITTLTNSCFVLSSYCKELLQQHNKGNSDAPNSGITDPKINSQQVKIQTNDFDLINLIRKV